VGDFKCSPGHRREERHSARYVSAQFRAMDVGWRSGFARHESDWSASFRSRLATASESSETTLERSRWLLRTGNSDARTILTWTPPKPRPNYITPYRLQPTKAAAMFCAATPCRELVRRDIAPPAESPTYPPPCLAAIDCLSSLTAQESSHVPLMRYRL
jgi:hypothetical protein